MISVWDGVPQFCAHFAGARMMMHFIGACVGNKQKAF